MTDWYLLRRFKNDRSDAAFSQLVARYIKLVYSVCYAELQDAQAAEDATQAVFLVLARKAEFRRGTTLAGWLFRTATFVSKHARRSELRRNRLQKEVELTHRDQDGSRLPSADSRLVLNEALEALRDSDREAVLLRYYQGMTLLEVGAVLGVSEDAARKRVARGVEKLRALLCGSEGCEAILAVLTAGIALDTVSHTLADAISRSASSGVPAGGVQSTSVTIAHQYTTEVLRTMMLTKLKATLVCIAAAAFIGSGADYVMGQGSAPAGGESAVTPAQSRPTQARPMDFKRTDLALKTDSLKRMKEIETGFITYASDYGKFPPTAHPDAVRKALFPYVKHASIDFRQPGANKFYSFNPSLNNLRLAELKHPDRVVFYWETKADPDGWRYLAYADGHVKRQSAGVWAAEKKASNIP